MDDSTSNTNTAAAAATAPAIRPEMDIQRAHDLLTGLIRMPCLAARVGLTKDETKIIQTSADVLCWVLEHEHNTTFADNLRKIEDALRAEGIFLEPMSVGAGKGDLDANR